MPSRVRQFDHLKVLSCRHMTSGTPEVIQVREQLERCENLWENVTTGLDSLPHVLNNAYMTPPSLSASLLSIVHGDAVTE